MPLLVQQCDKVRNLEVEAENTQATLRVFRLADKKNGCKSRERVFTCQVIAAGITHARITNGSGHYSVEVSRALRNWFRSNGYQTGSFERDNGRVIKINFNR